MSNSPPDRRSHGGLVLDAPPAVDGGSLLLMPGALSFVSAGWRLRTLLGSCVSVVVWHAGLRVGGMCHYLLARRTGTPGDVSDGRFGDEALQMLAVQMQYTGQAASSFVAHVAGGAQCISCAHGAVALDIGAQNVAAALDWCRRLGVPVLSCRTGGRAARHLQFDPASGQVDVRETLPMPDPATGQPGPAANLPGPARVPA